MLWARFRRGGHLGYGQLEGDSLTVYSGDIFSGAAPTGQSVKLAEVELLTPCDPSKMICLWNNFHALAAKLEVAEPPEPLYFRSEEHTSELQSLMRISYAVFCLKKKNDNQIN